MQVHEGVFQKLIYLDQQCGIESVQQIDLANITPELWTWETWLKRVYIFFWALYSINTGAHCKHQGAVARKFNLCSVNLAPFNSQKARQAFAILAVGESNIVDIDFYADLRAQDVFLPAEARHTDTGNSHQWHTTDDLTLPLPDSKKENSPAPPEDQLPTFGLALEEVVQDMLERVKEGDHNYILGLRKHIAAYKAVQRSHAPTASLPMLSTALDSQTVSWTEMVLSFSEYYNA